MNGEKGPDQGHPPHSSLTKSDTCQSRQTLKGGGRTILPSDNKTEQLTLAPEDILCIEAADNYVTVFHLENSALKKTVLRSTLKAQEECLSDFPDFFRAHKSYLVNARHIARVSGNAQGYRLHLDGMEETVPVSRKQNEALRELMR